jgi:hypothetical protein
MRTCDNLLVTQSQHLFDHAVAPVVDLAENEPRTGVRS